VSRQGRFGAGGEIEYTLRVNTEQTQTDLQKVITQAEIAERMLVQTLGLVRKLSNGNEDLDTFINVIQKAIMVVNQLRLASTLLMATSPWLVALGVIGIVGTAASMTDFAGAFA
jgi:hypothetical protein